MKSILWIQDKVVNHCATGMQPSQYKCGVLHKVDFRMGVKGEIKFNV
jgi:hypothetical protein